MYVCEREFELDRCEKQNVLTTREKEKEREREKERESVNMRM